MTDCGKCFFVKKNDTHLMKHSFHHTHLTTWYNIPAAVSDIQLPKRQVTS